VDIQTAETQAYLRWRKLKESAMTKKDYELIAAVMKSHKVLFEKSTKIIMKSLMEHLKKDNPKFNEDIFKKRSGFING
tara:strand:- start:1836 stop:2069 length:234 start_codon:yes stop_codon:yes gene_type:complete